MLGFLAGSMRAHTCFHTFCSRCWLPWPPLDAPGTRAICVSIRAETLELLEKCVSMRAIGVSIRVSSAAGERRGPGALSQKGPARGQALWRAKGATKRGRWVLVPEPHGVEVWRWSPECANKKDETWYFSYILSGNPYQPIWKYLKICHKICWNMLKRWFSNIFNFFHIFSIILLKHAFDFPYALRFYDSTKHSRSRY